MIAQVTAATTWRIAQKRLFFVGEAPFDPRQKGVKDTRAQVFMIAYI